MKNWKEEHLSAEREPELLQVIADGLYMERRNIRLVEHEVTETRDAYSEYVCECREIEASEYYMLQSITEIRTDEAVSNAIDEYTLSLMEGGVL